MPSYSGGRIHSNVATTSLNRRVPHFGFNYSRAAETQRARRRSDNRATAAYGETQYVGREQLYTTPHAPKDYLRRDRHRAHSPGYYEDLRHGRGMRRGSYGLDPRNSEWELEIVSLKQELVQTPAAEIKKNFEAYQLKFELQARELAEEMKRFVTREGDRVISSVLAGPHERILDPVWLGIMLTFSFDAS